jgi:hypothetical protein
VTEEFRPYLAYLRVGYDEQNKIFTAIYKFYLDEQNLWEEQLNAIVSSDYLKDQFWDQVKKSQLEIDRYLEGKNEQTN